MNKQIKFSYFDKYSKKTRCSDDKIYGGNITHFIMTYNHLQKEEVSPLNLYSGETDRNGKDLYVGDLVKLYHKGEWCVCQIVFHAAAFRLKWPDGYINGLPINASKYEKIGNIYETPELFK